MDSEGGDLANIPSGKHTQLKGVLQDPFTFKG